MSRKLATDEQKERIRALVSKALETQLERLDFKQAQEILEGEESSVIGNLWPVAGRRCRPGGESESAGGYMHDVQPNDTIDHGPHYRSGGWGTY